MRRMEFDTGAAHRLRLVTASGRTLEGEQVKSVTLTSCCCSESGVSVGNVCSAQLKAVVSETVSLLDQVLRAECVFPGETEEVICPLGLFRVTEWTQTEDNAVLTAYDPLYWAAGGEYVPYVGGSPTVKAILEDAAAQMGMETEPISGLAEEIQVNGSLNGYTIRELLGYMAALAGGNIVVSREGRLKLVWFTQGGEYSQEQVYSGGLSVSGGLYLAGMEVKVTEEETLYIGGGSGFSIELTNPFFTQTILERVWGQISTFNTLTDDPLNLGTLSCIGGLETEPGDLVTLRQEDGSVVLPAMTVVLELDGGAKCSVSAVGQSASETGAAFQGVLGKSITRLQADVAEFKRLTVRGENGVTQIDGKNIKTGTIEAESIRAGTLEGVNLKGETIELLAQRGQLWSDDEEEPFSETTLTVDAGGFSVCTTRGGHLHRMDLDSDGYLNAYDVAATFGSLYNTIGDGASATAVSVPAVQRGTVRITPSKANTPAYANVTFPLAYPYYAPTVLVTAETTAPGTDVLGVGVSSVTKNGCRVYLTRSSTTAATVHWVAFGEG